MKLEVGMYVRTKKGRIGRIISERPATNKKLPKYLIEWNNGQIYYMCQVKDFKASHKIINLIEVSDLVNGFRVDNVYNPTGNEILWFKLSCNPLEIWDNKDIKTIVTKEQLEAMQYKVVQE